MKHVFVIILTLILFIHKQGIAQDEMNIVVTSSWTAAYAKMAGIENFEMMAPSDMQHPSEYELQIDDILKLKNADLIICGGYEIMMNKIRTGLQIAPEKILQIKTDYNQTHISESVYSIAKLSNTEKLAERNLEQLNKTFEDCKRKIREEGISELQALVQFFVRPFTEELDISIAGIYGPRQLEAYDIQELMKLDFNLILDNAHNPSAQPLVESKKGARIAYLLNFPGMGNTESIGDVIKYNVEQIIKAYSVDH